MHDFPTKTRSHTCRSPFPIITTLGGCVQPLERRDRCALSEKTAACCPSWPPQHLEDCRQGSHQQAVAELSHRDIHSHRGTESHTRKDCPKVPGFWFMRQLKTDAQKPGCRQGFFFKGAYLALSLLHTSLAITCYPTIPIHYPILPHDTEQGSAHTAKSKFSLAT